MNGDKQLSFLADGEQTTGMRFHSQEPQLGLSRKRLEAWKQRIAQYQEKVRTGSTDQGSLFELPSSHADPEKIDPFALKRYSFRFFESPLGCESTEPIIYFVFDDAVGLLLYIGQAVDAYQRWSGDHDCRSYLDQYLSVNYQHQVKTAICFSFWWDTPAAFTPRLQLERALILKWRSPFNKENRKWWASPFTRL